MYIYFLYIILTFIYFIVFFVLKMKKSKVFFSVLHNTKFIITLVLLALSTAITLSTVC